MGATILYDGLNLSLGTGTGIATYARNLIDSARASGYRVGVAYPEGGQRGDWGRVNRLVDGVRVRVGQFGRLPLGAPRPFTPGSEEGGRPPCDEVWFGRDIFRRGRLHFEAQGRLAELATAPRPDLAHFTAPIPLRVPGALNLYTIHDLVPLRVPGAIGGSPDTFLRLHRELARRADHIVTVSDASRRDIIELLGVPPERVTNTHQSVSVPPSALARTRDEIAAEIAPFGLDPGGYFLFFGAIEPKKNVWRLLEAYLASGVSLPLVVVSSSGWANEAEMQMLRQAPSSTSRADGPRLLHVPFAGRELLLSLVKGARAVAFPSLYEGFGLPVLEAMSLGTPVLTSNVSSLPEVAGDAALLVDPLDVDAIRRGLVALAADDDLCAELSRRGPVQAERFSPERYRERVAALYTSLGVPPHQTAETA